MGNFALVQQTVCTGASSQAFPGGNTAGNCIIVTVFEGPDTGVTDSNGNTYTLIQTNTSGNIYAALNVAAGANTVTASPAGGALIAFEYSSANPAYFVCPGCSNLSSGASSTISNTVPGTGSYFTSPQEVVAFFACWQNGSIGNFTLPGATMLYNGTIPQGASTVAACGQIDLASITGAYSASPLLSSVSAPPSRSWGVFLNTTGGCPGAPGTLTIGCGSPPGGVLGSPYAHTFPATGGSPPYTFAITSGSLPPGLSLNTSTGAVTGTPSHTGTYPFNIRVTDTLAATATASCSITIGAGGPWIIQEITADLIPSHTEDSDADMPGHFRYTVRCVDQAQAGTYLGFWSQLGGGGGGSSGGGATSEPPGAPTQPPPGPEIIARNGAIVAAEQEINFIEGTNVDITATDDHANGKVDVTFKSNLTVDKNGSFVGREPILNLIEGTGISLTVADNPGAARVDATIAVDGSFTPRNILAIQKRVFSWTLQTSVTCTHNLNSTSVMVQVYDASGNQVFPQTATVTSANVVTLTFGVAFTGSAVIIAPTAYTFASIFTQSWTAQTSVTVNHTLRNANVIIQVYDAAGVQAIPQTATIVDANTVALTFGVAFTGSVVVLSVPQPIPQMATMAWTSLSTVTMYHNLQTANVLVQVFDSGGVEVEPLSTTVVDDHTVVLTFAAAFTGSMTVIG